MPKKNLLHNRTLWVIRGNDDEICFWGNGFEYQAAIFPTRKEAQSFLKRSTKLDDERYTVKKLFQW